MWRIFWWHSPMLVISKNFINANFKFAWTPITFKSFDILINWPYNKMPNSPINPTIFWSFAIIPHPTIRTWTLVLIIVHYLWQYYSHDNLVTCMNLWPIIQLNSICTSPNAKVICALRNKMMQSSVPCAVTEKVRS